ncbi:MAG: ABC transporter ATP-binding protein [Candidatus Eisenbacteria bacterium]|uniref:ABC transporter ATP-binding protein n=1 Tax=Eiseniibacteriota bacterium TaxID=2212470 RepID=A0A849SFS4_UNCEI|nr:ABC transporter ATP-binding protein [Candidatus Eisenbacteria bacterium]
MSTTGPFDPATPAPRAESTPASPPLALRGLVRRFGKFTAVDGVSLEVRAGEIVGFLGPNGAGKTTSLRMAAGLLAPDAGEVEIAGHSLERSPLEARARIGFVPDRAYLYERLTGYEFLEFVAALYQVPADLATRRGAAILERFEMREAAHDPTETYSHGMRQKLAVTAALLHEPMLLLLDEPLNGLDPLAARSLKDLLREHAARGGGILVSTHLLDVVERLCDRVVILHHGRVVAAATLDELRGAHHQATLEDVFLELTREAQAT